MKLIVYDQITIDVVGPKELPEKERKELLCWVQDLPLELQDYINRHLVPPTGWGRKVKVMVT